VDDAKDIVYTFGIYLKINGYYTASFVNPVEALYYFKKGKYDLILLDLKMSQIDGIAMFHALKNRDNKTILCLTTADLSY
jgi:DNA-binding response OmpR family regulator